MIIDCVRAVTNNSNTVCARALIISSLKRDGAGWGGAGRSARLKGVNYCTRLGREVRVHRTYLGRSRQYGPGKTRPHLTVPEYLI